MSTHYSSVLPTESSHNISSCNSAARDTVGCDASNSMNSIQNTVDLGHIEHWLNTLLIQNFSHHTLDAYRNGVNNLAYYLDEHTLSWTQCDKRKFSRYIAKRLEVDTLSSKSVQQEISAIRSFYNWLIDDNKAKINPTSGYKLKQTPRALPKIADIDVLVQLLEQTVPNTPGQAELWLRDKSMFELLYGSGLRVSELVSIDITDIDMLEKHVRVIGKGRKTRVVPMSQKAMTAIQAYLPQRMQWLNNEGNTRKANMALFISQRSGSRLTIRSVQQRLKISAKRAGIAQNMYPHLLRHCFASHMLSDSGDLRAIQEMLGHSNISTTQIYTQVDFSQLTQVYDSSHPRANR